MTDMPMAAYCREVETELFRVQCRILDLGTDTRIKSAATLRKKLMKLRDEIIQFRDNQ